MEKTKIDRINELAHLSKVRELSDGEKTERDALRTEYIAEWRKNAESVLENTYIIDENGIKRKLERKK